VQIPSGPVIDSEGLAVQTGSGAPVKKSYEEVHGKAALPRAKKMVKNWRAPAEIGI